MKYRSLFIVLFIFACGDSNELPEITEDQNTTPNEIMEQPEVDEKLNDINSLIDDSSATSNAAVERTKRAYMPYEGVTRKTNNTALNFNTYSWEDRFNYTFPHSPGFEKFEKDDHDSYSARTLVDGIIYEVAVEDYEKLGADKVDAGFTKYIHEKFIKSFSDDVKVTYEIETNNDVIGYASCYSYALNDRIYLADIVTFSFEDKMVRFLVTAKGEYENAVRVQEFVAGFKVL